MGGGNWAGSINTGTIDTAFQVAGVGDLTHNGIADIVWRDSAGHVGAWLF
jgi:hypothetical protein